ncbi:MAG: RHS repeat-associated core domain-containing protein [Candidatus Zixiibacteriota bacterium]
MSYSGAVKDLVYLPNYKAQVTEVGLGFSIPYETIYAKTLNTVSIDDDQYIYIAGGNSYKLIPTGSNSYVTLSANPWKITRIVGTIGGQECVIGWTVIKDNGIILSFGDSDDGTLRNATQYQLRWQNSLAPGADRYPELYPTQWDLASISDAEGLNTIEYSYQQEEAAVTVLYNNSSYPTVSTYTRASHISVITAPGGASLRFSYSTREDYHQLYPGSRVQLYSTVKLDSIIATNPDNENISGVRFTYSYLNSSDGSAYKKLLLTDIYQLSPLSQSEMLSTHFDYFTNMTDANYGAVSAITNSKGGEKEIYYSTIVPDSNLSDLSIELSEYMERYQFSTADDKFYMDRTHYSIHTSNSGDTLGYPPDVVIYPDSDFVYDHWVYDYEIRFPDNKDIFGTWNGFWDWESISHTPHESEDYGVASVDGWVARYDRDNNRLVVRRWMDGYWKVENVPMSWTPIGRRVRLSAGNNYIMAYDMDTTLIETFLHDIYFNGWRSHCFYMYKYDNGAWIESKMYKYNDAGNWGDPVFVLNYSCSSDLAFVHFGRRYSTEDRSKTILAKYLYDSQSLSIASGLESELMYYVPSARAMQRDNFCIWPIENEYTGSESNINTHLGVTEWDGSSWAPRDTVQEFKIYKTYNQVDSIVSPRSRGVTENVIFWEKYKYEYDMYYNPPTTYTQYMVSAVRGPSGWVKTPQVQVHQSYTNGDEYFDNIISSNGYVVTEHNDNLTIRQWVGAPSWTATAYGYVPLKYQIRALDNLVVTMAPNGALMAKKLLQNTTWSTTETLLSNAFVGDTCRYDADTTRYMADPSDGYPSAFAFTAQEDFIVAMNNSTKHVMLFVWEEGAWASYDLSGYMTSPGSTEAVQIFSSPNSFFVAQKLPGGTKHYCFRRFGKQFAGKAAIPVVDHIMAYRTPIDTDPVRVNYSYYGGILHSSGGIPRFARTTVSLPFKNVGGTPDGYSTHCFYNDIDDDAFSVSTHSDFDFPDLEDAGTYGVTNGGYLLDGLEYLNYSYTIGENVPYVCNDTIRSYYSVYHPTGYPEQVFRIVLDSTHSRQEQFATNVFYNYDYEIGRLLATHTQYEDGDKYLVDSMVYASDLPQYSQMLADNAIAFVTKQVRAKDSSGIMTILDKKCVDFEKHGNWVQTQSYIYENPELETGKMIIKDVLPNDDSFNDNGVLVASVNGAGDTSCVKLGVDQLLVLAKAGNCHPNDFLLQDFEQGESWDGWEMASDYLHQITTDDAFTGNHCYRIRENNNSTDHNWGPKRNFAVDSLTSTLYYFSGWVKATHSVKIFVFGWDVNGVEVPNGNKSYTFANVNGNEWTKVEGVFNIADMYPNLDAFQFRLVLEDFGTCPPDAWALFDDFRFHPFDAIINSTVFYPDTKRIAAVMGPQNVPTILKCDTYGRDSVTLNQNGDILSRTEFSSSTTADGLNWVKYTVFRSASDSSVNVDFYDGYNRVVQTRKLAGSGTTDTILVSGVKTFDARGREVKSYLPFIDTITPKGLFDYSDASDVQNESQAYYSAAGQGADCGNSPFMEMTYKVSVRDRVDSSAYPGTDWNMSSGHVKRYGHGSNVSGNFVVDSVTDADGVLSELRTDRWGRFESSVAHYTANSLSRTLIKTVYKDLKGRDTALYVDTLTSAGLIPFRQSYYNNLDKTDSVWSRDYGTIRTLYDLAGRVRFTQNDKQLTNNQFTYLKYDRNGRKIEEGVMGAADIYFTKNYSRLPFFPQSTFNPDVKYRWIYDYYVNSYGDTLIAPGSVVRIENGNSSYYREFSYYPEYGTDTVITKLPNIYFRKGVGHQFDLDGNLARLTFYPKYPGTSGMRFVDYSYDKTGQVRDIENGAAMSGQSQQIYAKYGYNAISKPIKVDYGIHINDLGGGNITTSIVQPFSYSYNQLGTLDGINELSEVIVGTAGGGGDSLHFAQKYEFGGSDPSTYFNGRLRSVESKTSYSYGTLNHGYRYSYNELGWLTDAEHIYDAWRNTEFLYNALGMRMRKTVGTTVTDYAYWPNSSRLAHITGLTLGQFLQYDEVGNLVYDVGNGRYYLDYNYRNLLTTAALEPNISTGVCDTLYCAYDESERRIMKRYKYQIYVDCDPPDPFEIDLGEKSTGDKLSIDAKSQLDVSQTEDGTEKRSCISNVNKYTYYLYDRDQVIATFDGNGSVSEYYVSGPSGRIATYRYNSDNYLYYHFGDHQKSERMAMSARLGYPAFVVQQINYTPFGDVAYSTGNYHPRFTYTDKEKDDESSFDLYYFGARYYNPKTGQFISADKASQYLSRYILGGNNPSIGFDPDGNVFGLDDMILLMIAAYSFTNGFEQGDDFISSLTKGLVFAGMVYANSFYAGELYRATGSRLITGSAMQSMTSGRMTIYYGIGTYDVQSGENHMLDFHSDGVLTTVSGYMDFSADYAKVMAPIDEFVIGKPVIQEGELSYDELADETKVETISNTKFHELSKTKQVHTWRKWHGIYLHLNPFDILAHHISEWIYPSTTYRYPNGGHVLFQQNREMDVSYHTDSYSPIYALNAINHLLFESEFIMMMNGAGDDPYYMRTDAIDARKAMYSREVYNVYIGVNYGF